MGGIFEEALKSAGVQGKGRELSGQQQTELAKAISRRYGIPMDAAFRTINYFGDDVVMRTDGNWDDEVEWHDKRIQQAIGQLSQEDGVDYLGGGSLSAKTQKTETEQKQQKADTWLDDVRGKLEAFAKEMDLPVDQLLKSDAYAQATRDMSYNQSATSVQDRGLSGGLSNYNSDLAAKQALTGYQMQRKGMGLSALSQLGGLAQGAAGSAEQRRQFDAGLNLQLQDRQAAANEAAFQQRQGLGQTIGSLAGGALGGLAGFVGSGFNPLGAAAGASLGAGLGGGLGGGIAGGYTPYRYRSPTGGSGRYGSGGYGNW